MAEVPVGQMERAEKEFGDQGFKPLLNTYAYSLNLRSRGLRSIKLRRAINHAVDREAIATAVYKGILQAPRGILPAGMPGFEEDACGALCEFSPSAARDLVASLPARFKSVTIEYPKEEPHGVVAKLLKKNLESVGLQASVNPYSFSKFLRLLQARDQSLYRLTWIAEYPSPDAFLAPLFESESAENHSGFSSKKVDTLLRRARSTGAETKRTALYAKAERAILEEVPIVPIGSFRIYWAAQPEVQDIQFDVMGGFDAAGVTLGP